MSCRRLHTVGWLLAGAAQVAAWVWLHQLGDLSDNVSAMWYAMIPILAGYLLAARLLRARAPAAVPVIIAVTVISRALMLDTAPTLSDDIYRYLWDGHVQAVGLNPYAAAPDDPALTRWRTDDWTRINHRELVTVYPPVAQWFFRLMHGLAPGVTGMKLGLLVCDLMLIAVLWRWLVARGQDGRRVLFYAWHPLPVLEIAGNGHIDILGVLLLCMGLLWLHGGRRHLAVWALAGAILSKLIPVMAAVAFWQQLGPAAGSRWRRTFDLRSRWVLLWVPVLLLAAWLPFSAAGDSMWTGLSAYATRWRANDSAFGLVYWLLSDPAPGWVWDDGALLAARWLGLGAVAVLMIWWATRPRADPAVVCASVFGLQLLMAPTVHPWYLLWVLPFLVLRATPAWVAFSWLVLLSYHTVGTYRDTGVWLESDWIRAVEYVPVYALLAWSFVQHQRRRHRRNTDTPPTSAV